MPSKKKPTKRSSKTKQSDNRLVLLATLVVLSFIFWTLYRFRLFFPVWFDETVGKAIFFGLPVWVYAHAAGGKQILDSWSQKKFKPGLLQGIAFGGIFGFVASITALLVKGSGPVWVPLFVADRFWWEFLMALLTGFWETVFFFSFVLGVLLESWQTRRWRAIVVASLVFLLFHLPNTLLRFSVMDVPVQMILLLLFSLGQAVLFAYKRNAYTLVLTQAIWGMVLLVQLW